MSNRRYSGINVLLLNLHQARFGMKSKFYGTYQQWKSIAGRIGQTGVPYAEWTARQIINAFAYEEAPCFLIRDRDEIYSAYFTERVEGMSIEEVPTAPRSPWQNPYCERIIGSIRRECLNHVIILSEGHLTRILSSYLEYYHGSRPHLSLDRNSPTPRDVEDPSHGEVVSIPQVGGLHHRYTRAA